MGSANKASFWTLLLEALAELQHLPAHIDYITLYMPNCNFCINAIKTKKKKKKDRGSQHVGAKLAMILKLATQML